MACNTRFVDPLRASRKSPFPLRLVAIGLFFLLPPPTNRLVTRPTLWRRTFSATRTHFCSPCFPASLPPLPGTPGFFFFPSRALVVSVPVLSFVSFPLFLLFPPLLGKAVAFPVCLVGQVQKNSWAFIYASPLGVGIETSLFASFLFVDWF